MFTYLLIKTKHGKNRIAYDKLLKHPEFAELHEVFGHYDIAGILETKDQTELRLFLQNKVWIIEDLESVETLIVAGQEEKPAEEPIIDIVQTTPEEPETTDDDGQFLPP